MPKGVWDSVNGNVVRGHNLINLGKNPDELVGTDIFFAPGYVNTSNMLNREEPFNQILDKPYQSIKNQHSGNFIVQESRQWMPEGQDVFIFAKLNANDTLQSIRLVTDGGFDSNNFFLISAYLGDRASQEPLVYELETKTTNSLTIADDAANSRTLFTFTTPDFVKAKDWYTYNYVTVSNSTTIPDGTYLFSHYRRPDTSSVEFALSTDPDSLAGTYLDAISGGSTLTNQTATFTFRKHKAAAYIYDSEINAAVNDDIPSNTLTGEQINWNYQGRTMHSILKESYSNHALDTTATWRLRNVPRLVKNDDIVYLGCTFVRKQTYDVGETAARLGFSTTYGTQD